MIIMKKHIIALFIIICAAVIAICCIHTRDSRQTMADSGLRVILDAGHGAFG